MAYMQYFSPRPNIWINKATPAAPNVYTLGFDLVSPDAADHKGIVYQSRKEQRSNKEEEKSISEQGSALLKNHGTTQNEAADVNITCFHMRPVGSLGNLLFQYATLLGICHHHEAPPHHCASLLTSHHSSNKPIEEIRDLFDPPGSTCPVRAGFYHDHNSSSSSYEIHFLPSAFQQPVGTTFLGFFQSFKYFSGPNVVQSVRDIFTLPRKMKTKALNYLNQFGTGVATSFMVCVSYPRNVASFIRHHPFINTETVSYSYYKKSIEEFIKMKIVGGRKDVKIILVPVGHGMGDENLATNADEEKYNYKINDIIVQNYNNSVDIQVFDAGEHFIGLEDDALALATLTQCPRLVLSSASLSWWGGFLANHSNVIAPKFLQLIDEFKAEDYYPENWKLIF